MRQLLTSLRESFNFILIDSPPVIAVSDAAVTSIMCDGVVLVFHGKKTTVASARQAVEQLDTIRAPILGVILNGVNLADPDYAYYRHYYGEYTEALKDFPNGSTKTVNSVVEVEPLKQENLSEPETVLTEIRPGIVPTSFFDEMVLKLREAAGPMASTIIKGHIARLGESQDAFPKARLNELFERISKEILNETIRNRFRQSIQEKLRAL
jgi:hypothetical protein